MIKIEKPVFADAVLPDVLDTGEIGEGYDLPTPTTPVIEGDVNDYTVRYANGVTELGGIKQIQSNPVTTGIIEGVVTIMLPFTKVLNVQATAMNVTNAPSSLNSERAHIAVEGNKLKIYASANSNSSATIPVSWTVKGNK